MHKLHKYAKKNCTNCISSTNSQYYHFGSYKLRISDHIGKNSEGDVHIIITKDDKYVTYNIHDQTLNVIDYEKAKKVVQSLKVMNEVASIDNILGVYKTQIASLTHKCGQYKKEISTLKNKK